jgi:hypothetical protein
MIGKMLIGFIDSDKIKNKNLFIKHYWVHHVTVNELLWNKFLDEKNKEKVRILNILATKIFDRYMGLDKVERAVVECIFLHLRRNGTGS